MPVDRSARPLAGLNEVALEGDGRPTMVPSCHSLSRAPPAVRLSRALAGRRTPAPPPLLGSGRCPNSAVCQSICFCRDPGEATRPSISSGGRQFTIVVDDVEQVVVELRRDALAGSLSPRI